MNAVAPIDLCMSDKARNPRFKPFPEQNADGVDLTLIRENLKLIPVERLRKAERARRAALRLQQIGRQQREQRDKSA